MKRPMSAMIAATATAVLCAGAATAATVTDNVAFTATGFTTAFGPTSPSDPVVGSFQITFDPTQTYTDETMGISLSSLNLDLGSQISFDFSPTAQSGDDADELVVGGLNEGAGTVEFGTDDFYLHLTDFTTTPVLQQLGYTTSSGYYFTTAAVGGVATSTPVAPAPEPSAWALCIVGVGMAGASLRLRRRALTNHLTAAA